MKMIFEDSDSRLRQRAFKGSWTNTTGRRFGCLKRRSKVGEICPLFSEAIKVIPKKEWDDYLKDKPSMRPDAQIVYDQDGVGSCAAESSVGNFTTTRVFNGLPLIEFNPWFVYHTTSGGRDGGSSIDENLSFLRSKGVAPVSIWPRSKGWRAKPSQEAYDKALEYRVIEFYDITNAEELGSALLQGFCVTFGRSGHAIYSIELVSTSTHRYMNSWGDWGDGGTEIENLSRINWGYGAFAIRVVTDTDNPVFKPRLSEMPPIQPRFEAFPVINE